MTDPSRYLFMWKAARLHYIRQRLMGEWIPEVVVRKPSWCGRAVALAVRRDSADVSDRGQGASQADFSEAAATQRAPLSLERLPIAGSISTRRD